MRDPNRRLELSGDLQCVSYGRASINIFRHGEIFHLYHDLEQKLDILKVGAWSVRITQE